MFYFVLWSVVVVVACLTMSGLALADDKPIAAAAFIVLAIGNAIITELVAS